MTVVQLTYPVEFDDGFAEAVTIRPLFDEERSLNPDPEMAVIEDAATATGLPVDAILELDPRDFLAIFEATAAPARASGETHNFGAANVD